MLNKAKGNMYKFISHTWNPIKGKCFHDCSYCYMKQIQRNASEPRLVWNELNTDLEEGHSIFIGSSCDMFAENIPSEWIKAVLDLCCFTKHQTKPNKYLLQSKNPKRFLEFVKHPAIKRCVFCTTLETNRFYPEIMRNAPKIEERVEAMEEIVKLGLPALVTVEPLMQFDHDEFLSFIERCSPKWVNIGRNTAYKFPLPEPTKEEVQQLITDLKSFTRVNVKDNALVWTK